MNKKTKRSKQWVKTNNKKKYIGIHLIADFWYGKNIEDPKRLKRILIEAAKEASSIPLKVTCHKFQPQGLTGFVLLAESHIALHSWPEFHYTAIDIYTCGDKSKPVKALEYLKKELNPKKVEFKKIRRGRVL